MNVNTVLQPGTAVNVTLIGNYTKMEAPYTGTLISYYADNFDGSSRRIHAQVI